MDEYLSVEATLPTDGCAGTLVGRVWLPSDPPGPAVVAIRADGVFDLTPLAPTMSELCNAPDPVVLARSSDARRIGDLAPILANSRWDRRDPALPWLLAPVDLQALKAAGVTFARSMLERVVEEQVKGDPGQAASIRERIEAVVGADLRAVKPGSEAAIRLKEHLVAQGAWSQYLEVGIGPDAEIFTKSQPMSAVGHGSQAGIHPKSQWNNPEPELVLVVNAGGRIVGATLGNDVNLRDVEGRSALLLGKAKDNNASCALGPFIRLVDATFDLDDMRARRHPVDHRGRGRLRSRGHELDARDQPRHRGSRRPCDRPPPRLPGRLRPVLRHDVRPGGRSRCAGTGLHPPPWRHRGDRQSPAWHAGQPDRGLHPDPALGFRHDRALAQPERAATALA